MIVNPSAADWAGARGDQWLAQVTGMEAMLRPVDEPLIAALRLGGGSALQIAEVGSGGGGTTQAILSHAPTGSRVQGFDISRGLVALARERAANEPRISFEVADMATAEPPQPYDRLVSRFGIMFFDEPDAAFSNLRAWLAPGGRFAFAVWGRVSENPWLTLVRDVVGEIIELPEMNRDAPGGFRYGDPSQLQNVLERAGFAELEMNEWRGELPILGSASGAGSFALASFSFFAELLAKAGDAALYEAQRALAAEYGARFGGRPIQMQACVRIFSGDRG